MENRNYASRPMPSPILHPPSPLRLSVANRQRTRKIHSRLLKKIAAALLADLEINQAELGINLLATREMASINETFLRHEGPTDVITFDYAGQAASARAARTHAASKGTREQAARAPLHGDIFICVDKAVSQAKEFRSSWQSEVVRYLVHGVLHLLGHDDSRPAERREMKREENRLVRGLSRRFWLADIARSTKIAA
jgi:probable rRNA maturation factor